MVARTIRKVTVNAIDLASRTHTEVMNRNKPHTASDSAPQRDTFPSNPIRAQIPTSGRVVYLMRGLPSCGKSRRAKELAGAMGVVCETDEFFHTQVGDCQKTYSYSADRQQEARDWNFARFTTSVDEGIATIVVDRGNGLNLETQRYARYAVDRGYTVLIAEPDSPWWQEIRVLLKYKDHTMPILNVWAETLANQNRSTHRTPSETIRRWIKNWNPNVTVEAILNYRVRTD